MSRGTLVPARCAQTSCTRLLRSLDPAFQPFIPLALAHLPAGPQPRITCVMRFGLIRVRSPLLTDSRLISLPGTTKMFQFAPCPTVDYTCSSTAGQAFTLTGFPHSDICGSRDICSSPQLFAACHVLLRLQSPRHSPCALCSLTVQTLPCLLSS